MGTQAQVGNDAKSIVYQLFVLCENVESGTNQIGKFAGISPSSKSLVQLCLFH